MAQPQEQVKQSYFISKSDDKYKVLKRPIGVDTDTSRYTTRVIEPSSGVSPVDLVNVKHLAGKKIDFNFSVSPGTIMDWDRSTMEIIGYFSAVAGNAAVNQANNVLMWNQLLTIFSEIHLYINGVNVFSKVGDEYAATQTLKLLVENSREELEAKQIVFAPIFDEVYSTSTTSATALSQDSTPKIFERNLNWLTASAATSIKRHPSLKDLFFSIAGYSKNMRDVKISFTIKPISGLALANHTAAGDGYFFPSSFRINLREVQPSPNSTIASLQDKLSSADEHLAFVDVESRIITYASQMVVNNQQNVQFIACAQFGGEFTNFNTADGSLSNYGQTQILNGYSSTAVAAATVLYRTDTPAGTACLSGPTSAQVQYGSDMYPSNAINLQNETTSTHLLETGELYQEYLRVCNKMSPAIKEHEFRRTLPMLIVKTHPSPKLQQSADIVIRLPGAESTSNTGTRGVRILWGKLKSYNLAPSGVVSEAVTTM